MEIMFDRYGTGVFGCVGKIYAGKWHRRPFLFLLDVTVFACQKDGRMDSDEMLHFCSDPHKVTKPDSLPLPRVAD